MRLFKSYHLKEVVSMSDIVLYSTGCPKCRILMKKLNGKGVTYTENKSIDEMTELGIKSAPVLKVGEELLDFRAAVRWADQQ